MQHILIPGFACLVTAPATGETDHLKAAMEEGYKIIHILSDDGKKFTRRVFGKDVDGQFCYSQFEVKTIPGVRMGTVSEENKYLPGGKVPITLLREVEKFFKGVIAKFGDKELEAMIWIMWNDESQEYFLHVPTQTVAGAAVKYDWDNLPTTSAGRPCRIIVDIHSHANFSAFFSGTDDRDDSDTIRYSGVLGFNRRPDPMMIFRFNFLATKRPIQVHELFDFPRTDAADTPSEWLEKVTVTTYGGGKNSNHSVHGYGGDGGYGGYGGQGGYGGYHSHTPHQGTRSYTGLPDQTKWKAPKPSNATALGWQGGYEGWFLEKGGGFIPLAKWEKDYERMCREEAEELAKEEAAKSKGGQQGTSPLELVVRETGQSSVSQKEPNGARNESSKLLQTSSLEQKSEQSSSFNSNRNDNVSPTSGARFPSNPFPQQHQHPRMLPAPKAEFQVGMGSESLMGRPETKSNSAGHSTGLSNMDLHRTGMEEAARVLSTAPTSVSTPTTTTTSTGSPDPLGVFTELVNRPVAYISETGPDGLSTLKAVRVERSGTLTDKQDEALSELEQATYQQELRDSQKALQSGSKGALLEETQTPVVPLLVKKTSGQTGTSEVSPLDAGFRPGPVSSAVLHQPQGVPLLQRQVPALIRKAAAPTTPISTTSQTSLPGLNMLPGEMTDDWLERRRQQVAKQMRESWGVEDIPSVSETMIERMHQRAQNESLLETAEDLAELQAGLAVLFQTGESGSSGSISVWPDDTVTLRLEKGDLPESFDTDVLDYGKTAAGAKAVIDRALTEISENGSLMRRTVQDAFEKVDEEDRLALFRTLVSSLSPKARESLATNGF